MLIYENAFPSTYEEIKTWYPVWYREVLDMDALWRVFGGQLDEIQAGIIRAVDNNFIDFADARTIARLEDFLRIRHESPLTLEERRNVLRGFMFGRGHIGRAEIKAGVELFTDGAVDVAFAQGGVITVDITHGSAVNFAGIYMVLGARIPAHLALVFSENLTAAHASTRYHAGAMSELTVEHFTDVLRHICTCIST